MPLSQPLTCPQIITLSANGTPYSRGAYIDTLDTVFYGGAAAGLLHVDTVNQVMRAPIAVGGNDIRAMDYNPVTGFLYAQNVTGNNVLKLVPSTGAVSSTIAATVNGDILFCPADGFIYATSNGANINRIDNTDAVTSIDLTAAIGITGATIGLGYAPSTGHLLIGYVGAFGVGGGIIDYDPIGGVATAVPFGAAIQGIAYGNTSGMVIAGRSTTGAQGMFTFNPVTLAVANLAGSPADVFNSIGYSSTEQAYYAVRVATGLIFRIDDSAGNFGNFLSLRAVPLPTNRAIPIQAGADMFVNSFTAGTVTIFEGN
jgi:hypothetical protein